jgi:hypothetical protein
MARNRMVKPEFFESLPLSTISLEANLLFIGLWVYCDDYGVHDYSIRTILGNIYRRRPSVTEDLIAKWLDELLSIEVLIRAYVEERPYIIVTNWEEHQHVTNPSARRFLGKDIVSKIKELHASEPEENRDYLESNEGLIRVEKKIRVRVRVRVKEKDQRVGVAIEKKTPPIYYGLFKSAYPPNATAINPECETWFTNNMGENLDAVIQGTEDYATYWKLRCANDRTTYPHSQFIGAAINFLTEKKWAINYHAKALAEGLERA